MNRNGNLNEEVEVSFHISLSLAGAGELLQSIASYSKSSVMCKPPVSSKKQSTDVKMTACPCSQTGLERKAAGCGGRSSSRSLTGLRLRRDHSATGLFFPPHSYIVSTLNTSYSRFGDF